MSYISGIRPQAVDDAEENASWYGEPASGRRIYAYVGNDPLNLADPLGLWTLQVGFSVYLGGGPWWVGGQVNVGAVADSSGNAGFYGTVGGGPTVGFGLKGGVGGAVSSAPTINDLRGWNNTVSAVGGAVVGGSVDWGKGLANGTMYQSWGGSVGAAGGAAVTAGGSYTWVACQVGPNCGSTSSAAPANGPTSVLPGPTSSSAPTDSLAPQSLTTPTQDSGVLGGTTGNQPAALMK
jgi:hypothetical protein